MNPFPLDQIAKFAGAVRQNGHRAHLVTNLSTDSRTLQPGDLFVALRGENFDGHKFVSQAFERGAIGAASALTQAGPISSSGRPKPMR